MYNVSAIIVMESGISYSDYMTFMLTNMLVDGDVWCLHGAQSLKTIMKYNYDRSMPKRITKGCKIMIMGYVWG